MTSLTPSLKAAGRLQRPCRKDEVTMDIPDKVVKRTFEECGGDIERTARALARSQGISVVDGVIAFGNWNRKLLVKLEQELLTRKQEELKRNYELLDRAASALLGHK